MKRRATEVPPRDFAPARTPEERQDILIARAMDLVEQRLIDGTASAQETTHFLKLATEKERLERQKISQEIELSRAKIAAIESAQKVEELYAEAMKAFGIYRGEIPEDEDI